MFHRLRVRPESNDAADLEAEPRADAGLFERAVRRCLGCRALLDVELSGNAGQHLAEHRFDRCSDVADSVPYDGLRVLDVPADVDLGMEEEGVARARQVVAEGLVVVAEVDFVELDVAAPGEFAPSGLVIG